VADDDVTLVVVAFRFFLFVGEVDASLTAGSTSPLASASACEAVGTGWTDEPE
jgi:hypothetical protein